MPIPARPRSILLATLITAWAFSTGAAPAATAPDVAVRELHALFDANWERRLAESPIFASRLGDRRWNDQWPEPGEAAAKRRYEADRADLAKLVAIDRGALPPAEQLNHDLFRASLEERVEGFRFRRFLMPLDHMDGIQNIDQLHEALRFTTARDYRDWIGRLRGFGVLMDGTIAAMRQGIAEGRTLPRILAERIPPQIAVQVVERPEDSPFFDPFEEWPADLPAAEREALAADGRRAIAEVVVPAYRRFQEFFVGEYLPGARTTIAARELPDGETLYAFLARSNTTTKLTPQEIHDIGLREVARIRAAMDEVIRGVGFKGSFEEFLHFLRTDPQFHYTDPQQLLAAYREICKRIDPELVKLFGRLPRAPYGVRPIPDAIAPDTTTAYYNAPAADGSRPGWYYVNLYRPETRPKYEMEVLSVHEAMPGHHLQIAIQQELGELPEFRRFGGETAFVEGWGLYSESLGGELGLYRDPYSRFGQLTYEMWRAVRLVVDTGMHQFGWDRQRAIDYFKANAAKTELDIVNEIDRYIADPGQALAYKIGELKLQELRKRSRERLGERFDVRAFHDVVLGSGALPLDLLERQVDAWIASTLAAPAPANTR